MRVRRKDKRNLVTVGAFLSALTLVLMIMIASIGKENSVFAPKVNISARVENVSNLKPGSYVELKGIRVGSVKNIEIVSQEQVEITAEILERELKWIRKDSEVAISNAGLVGDKFLEIRGGTKEAGRFHPEKDVLYGEGQTDLKQMISKGENIASVTERILLKVDGILTNLENGQKLVETVNSLNRTSTNLENITRELKAAKLGTMAKNVTSSMQRMDSILSRVEQGPGTAHSLVYDDALHEDLRALLGGAQRNKVIKYFIRQSIKKSEKKD